PAPEPGPRSAQSREIAVHARNLRRWALPVAATSVAAALVWAAPTSAAGQLTMLGADVSTAQRSQELGARYYDAAGNQRDPLDILRGVGVNYVRLRIWNNPPSGTNTLAKVAAYAQ